jgi:predicted RND superfamily exporter protein
VGSALVFANLALILGFLALCVSNFIPLVYFGALVGVAMFGGLVGNLVLLPALLQLTRRAA